MSDRSDLTYFTTRERQCREMSIEPGDVAVQRAHLNMANSYAAKILVLLGNTPAMPL